MSEQRICDCKGCRVAFTPKRKAQRFCSEACRNSAWKRTNGMAPEKRRLGREALPEPAQIRPVEASENVLGIRLAGSVAGVGFSSMKTVSCKGQVSPEKSYWIAASSGKPLSAVERAVLRRLGFTQIEPPQSYADTYPKLAKAA